MKIVKLIEHSERTLYELLQEFQPAKIEIYYDGEFSDDIYKIGTHDYIKGLEGWFIRRSDGKELRLYKLEECKDDEFWKKWFNSEN